MPLKKFSAHSCDKRRAPRTLVGEYDTIEEAREVAYGTKTTYTHIYNNELESIEFFCQRSEENGSVTYYESQEREGKSEDPLVVAYFAEKKSLA